MNSTVAEGMARIYETLEGNLADATPVNEHGLPGIFFSARMSLGDLSLVIGVRRKPTGGELSSFAWHFRDFAERRGYLYEVEEGTTPVLKKRLSTGDTMRAYVVQDINSGRQREVDISGPHITEPSILREYLASITP